MGGYLINFIVYTAAMVGVIFLAVIVYNKFSFSSGSRSKFLKVEDCINLAPRKNLYVIKAGAERFLVASDVGRTSLIAKLDAGNVDKCNRPGMIEKEKIKSTCSVDDLPTIVNFSQNGRASQKKVFKNIINNI